MSPDQPSLDPATRLDAVDLLECLQESAQEVFRTMVGLVGVLIDPDEAALARVATYVAVVEFAGRRSGAVKLHAGREGALDIARGLLMLGEQDEVDTEQILDALGECANMLSGSMKSKALDPTGCFTLGTPRVMELAPEEAVAEGPVYKLSKGCTSVEVWLDPV